MTAPQLKVSATDMAQEEICGNSITVSGRVLEITALWVTAKMRVVSVSL
jgi:hypothetical protein